VHLGITGPDAAGVVLAAVGLYLTFLVLIRVAGPGPLAGASVADVGVALCLGAVVGRALLGDRPTLAGGAIALATLFAVHTVARRAVSRLPWLRRAGAAPVLLVVDGAVLPDDLRAARLTESDLRSKLRTAGVGSYADVAAAVLEPTGGLSVIRAGTAIDDRMLRGVRGADRLSRSRPTTADDGGGG
jgi:uncharacterized membrane protein YcaP (DUF421 family)